MPLIVLGRFRASHGSSLKRNSYKNRFIPMVRHPPFWH